MKKSIAQLKFPAPNNEVEAAENSIDSIANDVSHDHDISAEFQNPEENWKNLNKNASSQSVLTLQKTKPQSKRSKRSILNPQNVTVSMDIPIFSNGFTDAGLQTKNTCAFDSLFSTFACIYSDYSKYQAAVDADQSSELCTFIKKVMAQKKITRRNYVDRNKMLLGLASQTTKVTKLTTLDCETGFGTIFDHICRKNNFFASSILSRTCHSCEATFKLVRPLLPISFNGLDLKNLQNHIIHPEMEAEKCPKCKKICDAEHHFNPVLALEVEAVSEETSKIKYRVGDLTQQINVHGSIWNVCGVAEHIGKHFICHMKRKNNTWQTYDDLSPKATELDTSKKMKVFMIFYINSGI